MSILYVTTHPEYSAMYMQVAQVRDAVKGSPFVKAKRDIYLPHPSSVDTKSAAQIARYAQYIADAEFDEFTANTKRVMLGRSKLDDTSFAPDSKLSYLAEDVDKDGLSMAGLVESCYSNVLEVKWHLLLTDYKGMSDLPIEEVSMQDVIDANPRATIKQYARERVIDWDFQRINGRMQLTYLMLQEIGLEVNHETGAREEVESYLKLGIDETGYYQQKKSGSLSSSDSDFGEKRYIDAGGKILDFIPVSICCDEEFIAGSMPMSLGFLAPIGELAMARYRVSAKYKEAMSALIPTLHFSGVSDSDWETFKDINGRDYVAAGVHAPNIWPGENTKAWLVESQQSLQQFVDYFDDNKNKVRAIGGVFKTDGTVQRTATEIINEAENITSVLKPLANNVESCIKWQIAYCAMFEGIIAPESVGDYVSTIELSLPKDFAVNKLTVEEVKALLDVYVAGLLPKDEFLKVFELGGWSASSAEDLLARLSDGEL